MEAVQEKATTFSSMLVVLIVLAEKETRVSHWIGGDENIQTGGGGSNSGSNTLSTSNATALAVGVTSGNFQTITGSTSSNVFSGLVQICTGLEI